ncbi:hypothetical protein SAMN04488508_102278 [Aquimarina spongiae]|uniref:Uncharacterized protein n=2 Tax=Aquimarina spongiae TaxID=570521 RepID=A0A1M6CTX2_9FLAO|nr:hypothetical protein SAMN04488508_102278 [Aquimarina spongiae]
MNGYVGILYTFTFVLVIPYDFILDLLYSLPLRTKKMFGNVGIYVEEKIVLATRFKDHSPVDNGIWIATKVAYQPILKEMFPSLRNLETYNIKSWLLLPDEADDFEEAAAAIAELIKQNSHLIGVIPKSKNKK